MAITRFSGRYAFLSNFYRAPVKYEEHRYRTAEHAYQAAKAVWESDRRYVQGAPTPGKAKKRGNSIEIRPDWEDVKDGIMLQVERNKFFQNPELAQLLLRTENERLVEGNTWGDTYWGVCNGKGLNKLGDILEIVRTELADSGIF